MLRAVILLFVLAAACSPPHLASCDVRCGPASASCPIGLSCASDGFCHSSADEPLCGTDLDAGIDLQDDASPRDASEEFVLGYDDFFLGDALIPANYLSGFAVTVPETAELVSFGLYVHNARGGMVQMALYDSSAAAGEPGALVAMTGQFADAPGDHREPPTSSTTLAPGQYWLFAASAVTNGAGCDKTRIVNGRNRTWTFGPTPPSSFGAATLWPDMHPVNYYLVLQ